MGLKTPIILRLSVFVDFNLWVHAPYHLCHRAWVRGFCRLKNHQVCPKVASYWSLQIRTIDYEFLKIHGSIARLWTRWMVVKTTKPQHKQHFPNANWWSHVELVLGPKCELSLGPNENWSLVSVGGTRWMDWQQYRPEVLVCSQQGSSGPFRGRFRRYPDHSSDHFHVSTGTGTRGKKGAHSAFI